MPLFIFIHVLLHMIFPRVSLSVLFGDSRSFNLGNQYHGVCETLKQITNNSTHLMETVKEQAAEISTLNEKLTTLQKLHKALEEKFARVMQFIENLHLKEKLDTFLHQKTQKHTR